MNLSNIKNIYNLQFPRFDNLSLLNEYFNNLILENLNKMNSNSYNLLLLYEDNKLNIDFNFGLGKQKLYIEFCLINNQNNIIINNDIYEIKIYNISYSKIFSNNNFNDKNLYLTLPKLFKISIKNNLEFILKNKIGYFCGIDSFLNNKLNNNLIIKVFIEIVRMIGCIFIIHNHPISLKNIIFNELFINNNEITLYNNYRFKNIINIKLLYEYIKKINLKLLFDNIDKNFFNDYNIINIEEFNNILVKLLTLEENDNISTKLSILDFYYDYIIKKYNKKLMFNYFLILDKYNIKNNELDIFNLDNLNNKMNDIIKKITDDKDKLIFNNCIFIIFFTYIIENSNYIYKF